MFVFDVSFKVRFKQTLLCSFCYSGRKLLNQSVVESFESNSGGFKKRQSDLRDDDYVSEHDMYMDELVKDFVDEENPFYKKDFQYNIVKQILNRFNKILKENENIENELSAGEDINSYETWNDLTYESPKKDEKNEDVEEGNEQADAYKTLIQAENEKIVDTSGTSSS
ncbi:hypothetical protein L2E82_10862 [Cichorium intybus]|uniref:Uncharacterized protein n=1 Tax=Cichorium intybus TaxID=13427 RepID=A0ACB9GBI7_CICIN|nr:hypothetical protein L2E82_10862 [Cichorium intybus]